MVKSLRFCIGRRRVCPYLVWIILILLNIFVVHFVLRTPDNRMKKDQEYTIKTTQYPREQSTSNPREQSASNPREQPTSKPTVQPTSKTTKKPLETTLKPTTKPIDMVDDYVPYVDFKLVYPEIMPSTKRDENIFLLVLVNSGANRDQFRSRRNTIRKTWGSRSTCEQLRRSGDPKLKDLKWMLVFVLGISGSDDDKRNAQEAREYNDMIIGNINDNYINNIVKFYMGQLWGATLHPRFIMKTDDDVYVRIPGVLEYLVGQNISGPFYGGSIHRNNRVERKLGYKWSISKKYYAGDVFPPFHTGAFFILSSDLHNSLFNYVYLRKPFHTDDAYIGVAMNDLEVKATHIPSFLIAPRMSKILKDFKDCKIQGILAFGHDFDIKLSWLLHDKLEKMCAEKFTIKSCR